MEKQLAEYLFDIVRSSIYADKSDILYTALKNRFVGFRAEIEFQEYCRRSSFNTFEGGYILPLRDKKETLNAPLYFTVDSIPPDSYIELYSKINSGIFSKLIYVYFDLSIEFNSWKTISFDVNDVAFPVPSFKIYDFQNNLFVETGADISFLKQYFTPKKNYFRQDLVIEESKALKIKSYLNSYSFSQLITLYVSRLVFDGFIGFKHYKGIPSDIDLIRHDDAHGFVFYEVKEKDLSKTRPVGFGIDVQRLKDCLEISNRLGVKYIYVVRQVDNQTDRNFSAWKSINFKDFDKLTDKSKIKEGGTGMNTYGVSDNPTLLVEDSKFYLLPIV